MVAWMIDTPPPLAPREELETFIRELENSQDRNHPDIRRAIAEAKRNLALSQQLWDSEANSSKTAPPTAPSKMPAGYRRCGR